MKIRMISSLFALALTTGSAQAQWITPTSQMEKLDRGVVALKNGQGSGNIISWRLLGTDDKNVTFNVLRDGAVIKSGIADVTYYKDATSGVHQFQVQTVLNGEVIETSPAVTSVDDYFLQLKLDRPASGVTLAGDAYSYSPNDCSVGDVDGDGQYELIVKWDPSNSQDNSIAGYTGNVYLDCYKLDGTKLWRVDLGKNIRAGAHYTQFLVYDFDGDGKAEMICKTAPGSKDGEGNYVSAVADETTIKNVNNTKDWRYSSGSTNIGKLSGGQEWLTVFNGETGKAVHTVYYNPNRNGGLGGEAGPTKNWKVDGTDTSYGNRAERYLATVAYLDGPDQNPSAVMCRGYYTYAYMWAVDFDGQKLKTKWFHASESKNKVVVTDADGNKTTKTYTTNTSNTSGGSCTLFGNGNHNLSCADVDGDGKDEIIYGSAAVDHDGNLLYAVGLGHGDAIHMSTLIPDRGGLQVFDVHEESPYGWDIHDAATGEVLTYVKGTGDNGRGMAADFVPAHRGFEFWSASDKVVRQAEDGTQLSTKCPSTNFRIYWDGDLQDELFDGKYDSKTFACSPELTKYSNTKLSSFKKFQINGKYFANLGNSVSCNTTKATPCLQADLFGDWREELILWNNADSCTINIFTTSETTMYRVPTLMHDHTYRMGITWQNSAYNQPPHLGFYLPDYVAQVTAIKNVNATEDDWITFVGDNQLRTEVSAGEQVDIAVYDMSGRLCWNKRVQGSQLVQLPEQARGTYMLKAKSNGNVYTRKFFVE